MNNNSPLIAIIEDDQPLLDMYKTKFESEGFRVIHASNGIEGLKLLELNSPDLVLLDIMMPEMDGMEMLEKLRQTEWGRSVKVFIMTNVSQDEVPQKINELGVGAFIVKAHTTPAQVIEMVRTELQIRKAN